MKTVQDILKEKNADYNISMFRQLQTLDYQHKVWHAEDLVHDFYQNNWLEDRNCHISVGGLDSITLLHFIRSLGYDADRVPAISCSSLEDKSIQKVHKQLGVISLPPVKRDDGTVWNKAKILGPCPGLYRRRMGGLPGRRDPWAKQSFSGGTNQCLKSIAAPSATSARQSRN